MNDVITPASAQAPATFDAGKAGSAGTTSARPAAMSPEEWRMRQELAAAYRLVAFYGMDDSIYTHISARVPGTHDRFLINPFGMLFRDITASSLVCIDLNGKILNAPPGVDVNPAGFTIHSAVHAARHDAVCVLHTHTVAGVAVSSLAVGLQPVNQWALQFHERVAYHDFEGIALDLDERERLVADIGPEKRALILRNHGLLTLGRSVSEAFILMHNLERACRVQVAIQSTGQAPYEVPEEIRERTARQYASGDSNRLADTSDLYAREWRAFLQRLEAPSGSSYLD